jgi:hypothetical protein
MLAVIHQDTLVKELKVTFSLFRLGVIGQELLCLEVGWGLSYDSNLGITLLLAENFLFLRGGLGHHMLLLLPLGFEWLHAIAWGLLKHSVEIKLRLLLSHHHFVECFIFRFYGLVVIQFHLLCDLSILNLLLNCFVSLELVFDIIQSINDKFFAFWIVFFIGAIRNGQNQGKIDQGVNLDFLWLLVKTSEYLGQCLYVEAWSVAHVRAGLEEFCDHHLHTFSVLHLNKSVEMSLNQSRMHNIHLGSQDLEWQTLLLNLSVGTDLDQAIYQLVVVQEDWPVLGELQEEWIAILFDDLFNLSRLRISGMEIFQKLLGKRLNIVRVQYFQAGLQK